MKNAITDPDNPLETDEQAALFEWADSLSSRYPLLQLMFAIPNGANKTPATAAKFKREGLKKGVPDIFLPVQTGRFNGMFIEMKRRKGGRVSEEQQAWLECLNNQGYYCCVCYGWDEARLEVISYLGIKE